LNDSSLELVIAPRSVKHSSLLIHSSSLIRHWSLKTPRGVMRISAKAEYACLAMVELAANHEGSQPARVKAIAETHAIPQRFLVQILLQLKGAGLVVSLRGAAGGYQLARAPEEISLADIINATDRTPDPSERRASPKRRGSATQPNSPAARALHSIWQDIATEEQRLLRATTLTDLVRRTHQGTSHSYQI